MRLTAPNAATLFISLVLALLAMTAQFVPQVATYIPVSTFWVAMVAYVLLLLGNVIRGL